MRRFVVLCQTATALPNFSLEDLPGTSGRIDVALRCIAAALLVSHGLRGESVVYLVLLGGGERVVRIDGRDASYLRPDERSTAGRIKAMLATEPIGAGFEASRQGMAVAQGGLEVVLGDVGQAPLYLLDEQGADIRGEVLMDEQSAVFFIGDHLGVTPAVRAELLARGARPISVGPVSVHADDAIVLVHNELDRRVHG
jgi:tRNA (pseudouridine54-N1)-methyltransferase